MVEGEPEDTHLQEIAERDELLDLPTGDYLNQLTSAQVTSLSPTRLIVLAGGAECGKTTLLASIFELFHKGPFAGFSFAGSNTLLGLEKRCHLARIASQRSIAETKHTRLSSQNTYLHFRVVKADTNNQPTEMLFTDLAGERFRLARDSTDECKRLGFIRRADRFVVILDGKKLADKADRHAAYMDGRSLLRSCLDAEMLGSDSLVDILVSKLDIIEKADEDGNNRSYIDSIKASLKADFSHRLAGMRFMEVAARPVKGSLPFGHNLDLCFPEWAKVLVRRSYVSRLHYEIVESTREMDRYGIDPIGE